MTQTPIAPAVLAGAGEAARAYLRMPADSEPDVVARACAAACGVAQAFLGADLAASWDALPGPVAQAIVLAAAQFIEHREMDASPPAAVLALLRPYRTARLLRDDAP